MAISFSKFSVLLATAVCSYTSMAAAPSPEKIFEEHIKALGGEAAIRAITTRYFDGTMENKRAKTISRMTVWQKAPNLSYAEVETLGQGTFGQGYDGKEAWAMDASGAVKVLTGGEAAGVIDSALMYGDLDWKTRYTDVKTVGDTTFEGKPAIEVSCKTIGGAERSIYFDPKTWLQLGVRETVNNAVGPDGKPQKQNLITIFDDFRDVAGVKVQAKFTQRLGDMEIISAFKVVEANKELKVSFDKPAGVKAAEPATPAAGASTASAPAPKAETKK